MEIEEVVNKALPEHFELFEERRVQLTKNIHRLIRREANERQIEEVVNMTIPVVSCPIENQYRTHLRNSLKDRIKILLPHYQTKVVGPTEFK